MADAKVHAAVARNLREFGYPDVTAEMIAEIDAARSAGDDLTHGVIGMFADRILTENGL